MNVKGTWFGCQEAIKEFLKHGRGGNIVNIVSTAGLQGHPKQSVYNISKGAAANLTRCLAIEYGRDKIRVNGICPTYAKTSLTRALFDDKDFDKVFTEAIPLKRWGEVEDIANLAIFLASDESSYVRGDLIRIDADEALYPFSGLTGFPRRGVGMRRALRNKGVKIGQNHSPMVRVHDLDRSMQFYEDRSGCRQVIALISRLLAGLSSQRRE